MRRIVEIFGVGIFLGHAGPGFEFAPRHATPNTYDIGDAGLVACHFSEPGERHARQRGHCLAPISR